MPEEIIKERISLILQHAFLIQSRISGIHKPDDFTATKENLVL